MLHLTGVNGEPHGSASPRRSGSRCCACSTRARSPPTSDWPTRLLSLIVTLTRHLPRRVADRLIADRAQPADRQPAQGPQRRCSSTTTPWCWAGRRGCRSSSPSSSSPTRTSARAAFVVLADRPKDEMEDELRRLVPTPDNTRVVCRTGDPGKPADLQLVNIERRALGDRAGRRGRATPVWSRPCSPCAASTRRSTAPALVAELESANHAETLRSLTDGRIATVQADQVISQVTAQACHQNGLAGVFRDLLDFDGDEIYFSRVPELAGHTYREVLLAFDTSAVIGRVPRRRRRCSTRPPTSCSPTTTRSSRSPTDDDTVIFTGFGDAGRVEVGVGRRRSSSRRSRSRSSAGARSAPRCSASSTSSSATGRSIDLLVDGRPSRRRRDRAADLRALHGQRACRCRPARKRCST